MKKTALVLVLALSACKGVTTAAPRANESEISAERATQQQMAEAAALKRDGKPVPVTPALTARLKKVADKVSPAGESLCKDIGRTACKFGFKIEESPELNAYADGQYIVVSSAMIDFTTDDELADVIAHEYAHNVMSHVATQTQNAAVGGLLGTIVDQVASARGINTGGMASQLGQNYSVMKYSVSFEQEADYVGLYIMDRAGYDINKSPDLWRKMSQADSRGITMRTTHPSNPERYVSLQKGIDEIKAKKAAKQPLVPDFKRK